VILVLLALAAGTFWFAFLGVESGETRLPAKFSGGHTVTLKASPALFWVAIATISSLGLVCVGIAVWLAWITLRRR
jgi:hypothetical protein